MLIDSDILVDIVRKHPPAVAWFATLTARPFTTGFSAMELISGCVNAIEQRKARRFLAGFDIVWPEEADLRRALDEYVPLRLSVGISVVDSLIAGVAVGRDLPLATFNTKHYKIIAELVTVQPYIR